MLPWASKRRSPIHRRWHVSKGVHKGCEPTRGGQRPPREGVLMRIGGGMRERGYREAARVQGESTRVVSLREGAKGPQGLGVVVMAVVVVMVVVVEEGVAAVMVEVGRWW